jgi:hypothetical protein
MVFDHGALPVLQAGVSAGLPSGMAFAILSK